VRKIPKTGDMGKILTMLRKKSGRRRSEEVEGSSFRERRGGPKGIEDATDRSYRGGRPRGEKKSNS